MKRVLLVTSKYPYSKTESDGGLTTVASVIESLKNNFELDILFVRKYSKDEEKIPGVKNIFFEEIKYKSASKFERRIFNYEQVSHKILEIEKEYDFIVIIHASKAFGLENASSKILEKIVLYPMFLSYAYRESGENVPLIYDELECKMIKAINWFVCPSKFDKATIMNYYNLDENRFFVIPRSVSSFIKHYARKKRKGCRILSIGNIKERKQPLSLLKIFKNVKNTIESATLVFAGEIQDESLYKKCIEFIRDNDLTESVRFVGTVSQRQIAELIENSDINVCTSNLETFGRCVFEGMYGGLPTVVFDKLSCVKEFVNQADGISFVADENEFSTEIISLLLDENKYIHSSEKAILATEFISFESEKYALINALEKIGGIS